MTDLLFHFKKPILLFPLLVLVILLFWIAFAIDGSGGLAGGLGVLLFIIGFVTFFAVGMEVETSEESVTKEEKETVDKNWEFLRGRIKLKLTRNQWLNDSDLGEIAEIWEISLNAMNYALAKYAFESPKEVEYGYVYRKKDNELISGRNPVLINLESIDEKHYWYSSS